MKILYRYISAIYIPSLLIFVATLTLIFISLDMSTKLNLFLRSDRHSSLIFEYYAPRLPVFILYLLPVSNMFAAAFTVIRLNRDNELIPMLVSGLSIRRMSLLIGVYSLFLAGLMFANENWLLPELSDRLVETSDALRSHTVTDFIAGVTENGSLIYAESYDRREKRLQNPRIIVRDRDGKITKIIKAQYGIWSRSGHWEVYNGEIEPFENGNRKIESVNGELVLATIPFTEERLKGELVPTPADLARKFSIFERFSTIENSIEHLKRDPDNGFYRTQLFSKFSQPTAVIFLAVWAFPIIVSMNTRNYLAGLSVCFVTALAYQGITIAGLEIGSRHASIAFATVFGPVLAGIVITFLLLWKTKT